MQRKQIKTGAKFGKWKVVALASNKSKSGSLKWVVECICGSKKRSEVRGADLRNGHSSSCGCTREKHETIEAVAVRKIIRSYEDGATERNLTWDLSEACVRHLLSSSCHYCKSAPNSRVYRPHRKHGDFFEYSGIDRLDNRVGYYVSNVVACCKICNRMKSNMSVQGFLEHIRKIKLAQSAGA